MPGDQRAVDTLFIQRLNEMNDSFTVAFAKIDNLKDELHETRLHVAHYNGLQEKVLQSLTAATEAQRASQRAWDAIRTHEKECPAFDVINEIAGSVESMREAQKIKDELEKQEDEIEERQEDKQDTQKSHRLAAIQNWIALASFVAAMVAIYLAVK